MVPRGHLGHLGPVEDPPATTVDQGHRVALDDHGGLVAVREQRRRRQREVNPSSDHGEARPASGVGTRPHQSTTRPTSEQTEATAYARTGAGPEDEPLLIVR